MSFLLYTFCFIDFIFCHFAQSTVKLQQIFVFPWQWFLGLGIWSFLIQLLVLHELTFARMLACHPRSLLCSLSKICGSYFTCTFAVAAILNLLWLLAFKKWARNPVSFWNDNSSYSFIAKLYLLAYRREGRHMWCV